MLPTKLPVVGRISGAELRTYEIPEQSVVVVEYEHRKDESYELEMPFLDAMYLLNCLREIERIAGFESQNKPPKT